MVNNNNLIIAAAGSGKTRKIVDKALAVDKENVLITTFTEANKESIVNKIIRETQGYIPNNITVQTWFSFLLENGVRPYQDVLNDELWDRKVSFYLRSGSSSVKKTRDGEFYSIGEKDFYRYYFNNKNELMMHSDKVSEFSFKCNKKSNGIIIKRLSRIYPNIFIDEIQDLAGYDLKLLKLFFNSSSRIIMVGDPRQATYSTHNPKKYKGYIKSQIVDFFYEEINKDIINIDLRSLTTNYRSNESICNFSNKLFPEYSATISGQKNKTGHDGIFILRQRDIERYLKKYPKCIQLRWNAKKKIENGKVMNFGESKGLDFDRVLIHPTTNIVKWMKNNDTDLSPTTKSKFYVALTRARYSVTIVYDYKDDEKIEGANFYDD